MLILSAVAQLVFLWAKSPDIFLDLLLIILFYYNCKPYNEVLNPLVYQWLDCPGFVMLTVIIVELFSSCISFFHSQLSAILSMPRPLLLIQHSKKFFLCMCPSRRPSQKAIERFKSDSLAIYRCYLPGELTGANNYVYENIL